MAFIPYWRSAASRLNDYVHQAQQRDVDIKRLWRRTPQAAQAFSGRPGPQSDDPYTRILICNGGYALAHPEVRDWLASATSPAGVNLYGVDLDGDYTRRDDVFAYRLIIVYGYGARLGPILPGWRDVISSGYWNGRLVMLSPTSGTGDTTFYKYINDWSSITGLTISSKLIEGPDGTQNSGTMNHSSPFAAGVGDNISAYFPHLVSGGNDISYKVKNSSGDPSLTDGHSYCWIQDKTVTGAGGMKASFIVGYDDTFLFGGPSATFDKPFFQNLWGVAI